MPKPRAALPERLPSPAAMQRALDILCNVREQLLTIDPTITQDEKLYTDMLDAEGGNALDVIGKVVLASLDADDLAAAAQARKLALGERQARFERRSETLRKGVLEALLALDLPKLERPDFTLSVGASKGKVIITDESALAPQYVRVTRTPDKLAIGMALHEQGSVLGAELSNPEPHLTVRVR